MSVDYSQLTPLKALERAGILNLPTPNKMESIVDNGNLVIKTEDNDVGDKEIHNAGNSNCQSISSFRQPSLRQDLAIIDNTAQINNHAVLLKSSEVNVIQNAEMSSMVNISQYLSSQACIDPASLEPIIQQPSFIINDGLKEELNVIIETPASLSTGHLQQFDGIHGTSSNVGGLRGVRSWGETDIEAIITGKHVVLVKKILKPPNYNDETRMSSNERVACSICSNEFANKNVLMRHQVVHSGDKPHCCFTCFKQFNDISSLRKHSLIHKRSHRCPVCMKLFLRRRQMELHLRHHNKKRFIQFGNKYYEVQVITTRNEKNQIMHEFTLLILSNKDIAKIDCEETTTENVNVMQEHFETSCSDKELIQETKERQENIQTSLYKRVIYKCGHCKKIMYTRPTLSRHLMIHTNEKPFNCEICRKEFRHRSDLVHHYKTHMKPVKCQTCGIGFSKQLYLNKHLEKGCPFIAEDNDKFTILSDLTYQCNTCNKILKSQTNVYRHMKVHAFQDRKNNKPDSKKPSMVKQVNNSEQKGDSSLASNNVDDYISPLQNSVGYQCTICKGEFRFKSFILIHVRMHLNLRPFKCDECGRSFHGRFLLRKHQQIHTKPYKCPKCGKGFNRRYIMTKHFIKVHSEGSMDTMKDISVLADEKTLQCDICGKTMKTYQKSLMQYHIRLHKDVRPYKCKDCQKSFSSDIALKKHRLNHKKPYTCHVCNKGFSRRYLMLEHFEKTCRHKLIKAKVKTQNGPTKTDVDLESFKSSNREQFISINENEGLYQAETMTEVDDKNGLTSFKCVPCDKSFNAKNALMRHINTFMRQTPCKYCKTIFKDKHLTLAHQRSCLGIEFKSISSVENTNARNNHSQSESQEKVQKIMEEMNKAIKHYTSDGFDGDVEKSTCSLLNNTNIAKSNHFKVTQVTVTQTHKQHENQQQQNSKIYACLECNKSFFTTRGLKIHATCHVRLFKCETCGEDFTHIKDLRKHLQSHSDFKKALESDVTYDDGEENQRISTQDDSETLMSEFDDLKDDNKKSKSKFQSPKKLSTFYHKGAENTKLKDVDDVSACLMKSGTRGRPFSCKMCRKRFTEESGLKTHVMQSHKEK